jgi:hypothetical protein
MRIIILPQAADEFEDATAYYNDLRSNGPLRLPGWRREWELQTLARHYLLFK